MGKVKSEKFKTSGLFGRKGLSFIGGDHSICGVTVKEIGMDVVDCYQPRQHSFHGLTWR